MTILRTTPHNAWFAPCDFQHYFITSSRSYLYGIDFASSVFDLETNRQQHWAPTTAVTGRICSQWRAHVLSPQLNNIIFRFYNVIIIITICIIVYSSQTPQTAIFPNVYYDVDIE